ncbi:hypothetical protein IEQ34_009051 [Dendrobium chrysotoxum]|uniref:Uncharacterized protein n=1 Tax=Dendrobium chrysotoxum TaxID=161865 RepID=A0AAV7GXJ3_DENCH|nr:hypothetical protein IEQ34_009051 [Dendrobium chrysotoxum]
MVTRAPAAAGQTTAVRSPTFLAMLRAQAIFISAIKQVNFTTLFLINSSKKLGITLVKDAVILPKLWRSSSNSRPSGIVTK